jgi:hypothetical protein
MKKNNKSTKVDGMKKAYKELDQTLADLQNFQSTAILAVREVISDTAHHLHKLFKKSFKRSCKNCLIMSLREDNAAMISDKIERLRIMDDLAQQIGFCEDFYEKIEKNYNQLKKTDAKMAKKFSQEILSPLKQKILDLKTAMIVNEQGVIINDMIIIGNNRFINSCLFCKYNVVKSGNQMLRDLNAEVEALDPKKFVSGKK